MADSVPWYVTKKLHVVPAVPVLTIVNNENGTATATIATDTVTSENTLLISRTGGPWTSAGTVTGSGTILITATPGTYAGYVVSLNFQYSSSSLPVNFVITRAWDGPIITGWLEDNQNCQDPRCAPGCAVFDRIITAPRIEGGTLVQWSLSSSFHGMSPYRFQLQVGTSGNPYANDWEDVGVELEETYMTYDPAKRGWGKQQWTHYRILLHTADYIIYASPPEPILGTLSHRDWLLAREIKARELKQLQLGTGSKGFLLKRKVVGQACSCRDPLTKEPRIPNHPDCYGTGIVGGYYLALGCHYMAIGPHGTAAQTQPGRGTVDDASKTIGRCLAEPQLSAFDVWVEEDTDFRWVIHSVRSLVDVRGLPLVLQVDDMRRAPFSDIVYTVPLEYGA